MARCEHPGQQKDTGVDVKVKSERLGSPFDDKHCGRRHSRDDGGLPLSCGLGLNKEAEGECLTDSRDEVARCCVPICSASNKGRPTARWNSYWWW